MFKCIYGNEINEKTKTASARIADGEIHLKMTNMS